MLHGSGGFVHLQVCFLQRHRIMTSSQCLRIDSSRPNRVAGARGDI
jgi:hypothetical protein